MVFGNNRFIVTLGACVLGLMWLSVPTALSLHQSWSGFGYSHGYLITLIVGGLVCRELRRVPLAPPRPSAWGVAALSLCVLGTLLGHAADALIVAQFFLPLLLLSTLWTVTGWQDASRFWQPLFYLYFAIPFWDVSNETLLALTTNVVSFSVHAVGIPAYIEGNRIFIPSGTFEVAGGCSGLHFFIVGLALAGVYGLLYLPRWRERIVLAALAAALALTANWLRVFVIVVVGHRSQMQHYLVEDHYYFGWVLFLLVIAPMILVGRWLEEARAPGSREPIAAHSFKTIAATGLAVPVIAGFLLIGGAWLGHRVEARHVDGIAAALIELPELATWQRMEPWADSRRPYFVGAGAEAAAWYRQGTDRVAVYVANYPSQQQGREAVFYANRPWGEADQVIAHDVIRLSSAEGTSYSFAERRLADPGGSERLVWYGLQVAGRPTASELIAKFFQAVGALGGRTDAQVLVLTVVCEPGCSEARAILSRFATQAVVTLYAYAENSTVDDDAEVS